ncbi:unnamed protein product, partial [Clonostachys solani]
MAAESTDRFVACVRQGVEAVKNQNRAPANLLDRIEACSRYPGSKIAQLLARSLGAWFLVVAAIEDEAAISDLTKEFSRSDINTVAERLDDLLGSDKSLVHYFHHTFHTSQRAKERQSYSLRFSKRPRPQEFDLDDFDPPSRVRRLDSESSNMTANTATGTCGETLQPHFACTGKAGEAHGEIQPINNLHRNNRWLKASVLPTVFPQRMCDGVLKDTIFACINVSYTKDANQCSLDIDVTSGMASTLAKELFDKFIRYDTENAQWVMELSDGTDVFIKEGQVDITRAREPAIQRLLGTLVSTTFQNNPQRHEELAK